MTTFRNSIKHDGGTHNVVINVENDQLVLRFGSSFTLRVDEKNADRLRDLLYDASRELAIVRANKTN
jgi:hypothetical protein